jgi:hypothetical protein
MEVIMYCRLAKIALTFSFMLTAMSHAQEVKPLVAEAPTNIVAAPQQWLSHQHWFCPPSPVDPNHFAKGMNQHMNAMGDKGWEVVSFAQMTVNKGYCYVVTYKAPKRKP